jgi:serine/threonine protein kinase/tetratricopeptide (TPR) repeat protein
MSTDPRVSDLLLTWEERREQGHPVSVEELCRDCPHLLPEVRRQVQALQAMNPILRPRPRTALPTPTFPGTSDQATATWAEPLADCSAASAPLPVIPGYEVLRELGRGGMGIVYLARQTSLGRLVALKMLRADQFARRERRRRFRAEAEAVARLQHPNIVQVYEAGEAGGQAYCVFEYVPGRTLAEALDGASCPPRDAAELLAKLASAMQAAHERGIIHRDLKPTNVLLSFSREPPASADKGALAGGSRLNECIPKITDFGLAKDLEAGPSLTRSGTVIGTPSYMAPEQAGGRIREVGPAADTYSLGTILFEALTGRPPFVAASTLETIQQVLTLDPLPPGRLQPGTPRDLETICLKCLQKDPARRYGSARDLADDLGRFLRGEPVRARTTHGWERLLKWIRRRPAAAGFGVFTLLALLTLTCVAFLAHGRLREELNEAQAQHRQAEIHQAEAVRRQQEAQADFQLAHRALDDLTAKLSQVRSSDHLRKQLQQVAQNYHEEFLARHGSNPALRAAIARSYLLLAQITATRGSPPERVIELYDKGLRIFDDFAGQPPANRSSKDASAQNPDLLRQAYLGRALALNRLGRYQQALADLDRAERLAPERAPGLRIHRAETLARLGRVAEAVDLADHVNPKGLTAPPLVHLARVYALGARTGTVQEAPAAGDQGPVLARRAGRALALLRLAAKAGHFKSAAVRARFRQDPDFVALRGWKAFQDLVAEPK